MVEIINRHNKKEILDRLEDYADVVVRRTQRYLPHVARLCLVATFIEDGFRLCTQWHDQVHYIRSIWSAPTFLAGLFIFLNIVMQFSGSGLILARKAVKIGCGILMGTIALQAIGYDNYSMVFLIRSLSLTGSLVLLLAESRHEARSMMAGLPSTGENAPRQYMLLGGRILVVLMLLTVIDLTGGVIYLIHAVANLVLTVLVAVGYKTKLCAVLLVVWLTAMNFWYNNFWAQYRDSLWDFVKYEFFQTWSVIGGLMLIVVYGPGGVSVDSYKKKW